MDTQKCTTCGKVKELIEFVFRNDTNSHRKQCKECTSEQRKKYYIDNIDKIKKKLFENKETIHEKNKIWRENNKEKIAEKKRLDRIENPEKYAEYYKTYYDKNKEKRAKNSKDWYLKNKEKVVKRSIKRNKKIREESLDIRIRDSLRARVRIALKGTTKSKNTAKLIGCSVEELKQHLEKQFTKGMTWDNYGYYGWHIDHIKPCAKFDLTDSKQQAECFSWKNLQPLWMEDNFSKGAR